MTSSPNMYATKNPVIVACKAGKVQTILGVTTPSPQLAQMLALSGFDAIMIDMEHGPIDIQTCFNMISTLRGTDTTPFVRVASNDPVMVKQALDAGAEGIVFPMICNREEAEKAVRSVKYPPLGDRGWGPFQAQFQWGTDMFEYSKIADERIAVVFLIEHPEALDNLDEILSVPGIDVAAAVPFDLAVNMGYRDGPGHPDVQRALAETNKKIAEKGILTFGLVQTPEQANQLIANGTRLITIGGFDAILIPQAIRGLLSQLNR